MHFFFKVHVHVFSSKQTDLFNLSEHPNEGSTLTNLPCTVHAFEFHSQFLVLVLQLACVPSNLQAKTFTQVLPFDQMQSSTRNPHPSSKEIDEQGKEGGVVAEQHVRVAMFT